MRNSYNIAHNANIDVTLTMFAFAGFYLLQLQYFISSTESLMFFRLQLCARQANVTWNFLEARALDVGSVDVTLGRLRCFSGNFGQTRYLSDTA